MELDRLQPERRRRTGAWPWALALAIILTTAVELPAATLYVSRTSANPSPPYATADTAAQDIQDAVAAASDGDTVLVAPGQYDLTNQVTITRAINLRSTMGADQTFLNVAFGDYGLWVSNSAAVVDGFTIQQPSGISGNPKGVFLVGETVQSCTFSNFFSMGPGTSVTMKGGILSNSVVAFLRSLPDFQPTGVDCTGGGLVTDCRLLIIGRGEGVGIHLADSQMRNSVVSGTGEEPGNYDAGQAVSASGSTITDCQITHNWSMRVGGGAYLDSCLMDRCILAYNTCAATTGGGIFETNSTIRDSLIVSNRATIPQPNSPGCRGGGVYMQGGGLVNCTVSENSAGNGDPGPGQGGGVYAESGGITNCIIYGNYASAESDRYNVGLASFDHCCTSPDPGGSGNIVQDPQFLDQTNGNYHLASTSPCLGAGVVQDWMSGASDLDGDPRTTGGVVDIGAYQRPPANPPPPSLRIFVTATNTLVIAWPATVAGCVLEQKPQLGSSGWTTSNVSPSFVGGENQVTVSPASGSVFYRLRHL